MNKSEIINWKGDLALDNYDINDDPNPEIILKKPDYQLEYTQQYSIRYLRPPTPPSPSTIYITKQSDLPTNPAPPLIIRQQPLRVSTPKPIVLREHPPAPPKPVKPIYITIPGKRAPPPPRRVVIERIPSMPDKPPNVIIERWLPYETKKRRVIFKKSPETNIASLPRNLIIQWETPKVVIKQEVKHSEEIRVDPNDYIRRYGSTLKNNDEIQSILNRIVTPIKYEKKLACKIDPNNKVHELTGDLEALELVDLDKEGLSEYKEQVIKLGFVKEKPKDIVVFKSSVNQPTSNKKKMNREILEAIFDHIGRATDGYVSVDEARSIFLRIINRLERTYHEDEVTQFLGTLELKRNGVIIVEEFREAFIKLLN